jgi:integrase
MPINLNFQTVKNLRKPGRYTDGLVKGLHIWVNSNQKKYWIFRYTFLGKQQNISLGSFPMMTISQARIEAQKARESITNGINPIELKKSLDQLKSNTNDSKIRFDAFALQCIEKKKKEWRNEKHANQWLYTLENFAFPIIGNKYLDEIDTNDVLKILNPIWLTKTETAARLRGRLEWILASATTQGLREGINPAMWRGHLQTILPMPNKIKKIKHHAALPYRAIPEFFNKLKEQGTVGALALEFTILNASRTGEVIQGRKDEIEGEIWTIPATRMKANKEHQIPLCERSLEILKIAAALDPGSPYLFSRKKKTISNMAMTMALRRIAKGITVHGFRSSFRDWISEETEHSPEVAEMALAHTITSKVESSYRRGNLRGRRKVLLTDWENYCLSGKSSNVITLKAA